jgi:VWFA-related protein
MLKRASAVVFGLSLTLQAQPRPDIRVNVDLVTVTCSVTDRGGAPAKDLQPDDFILTDNGVRQPIRNFWQESDLPLTLALVADVSGSQLGFVKSHRDTLGKFLVQVVSPRDRAMLVSVGQQAWLMTDLTNSGETLQAAAANIGSRDRRSLPLVGGRCTGPRIRFGCGGTALWHGLYFAARDSLRPADGRKAMIVLSDGWDTGSDRSLTDVIEAAQSADTVVYTIKYLSSMRFTSISGAIMTSVKGHTLDRLARETGGHAFGNPREKLAEVFTQIENELRNQYVLAFTPADEARDGKFHKLEVKTTRKDLVVRARTGYYSREKERVAQP